MTERGATVQKAWDRAPGNPGQISSRESETDQSASQRAGPFWRAPGYD